MVQTFAGLDIGEYQNMKVGFSGTTTRTMLNQLFRNFNINDPRILRWFYPMTKSTARKKIAFSDPPVERPEECPREFNSVPSEDPPESVNFKMLNRRIPRSIQSNPQSFHERFYGPGEGPSVVSPRFYPREDEDIDISLPWRMSFDEDFSFESAGEASRQEYINLRKRDAEEEEAMRQWGPRRRMLHEQATRRRSPPLPRGRGVEVPPPDFYFV